MKVRRATQADIPDILRIKQALAFSERARGGFLLGCDQSGYEQRLHAGSGWMLQSAGVAGFAITLGADAFRQSAWWRLRHQLHAVQPLPQVEHARVGYFDQLGVVGNGVQPQGLLLARCALVLAHTALAELLLDCEHVVTSTVSAPVLNLAAVPFIQRVGGRCVGQVRETYADVGELQSDVWWITRAAARASLNADPVAARWLT